MTENSDAEFGISISDIVRRLWAWRGLIVFVPLLFAGFAALLVVVASLAQNRQATYLISLRNIENQRYPNGAEFSPRDLLIPEVLAELRSRYDIAPDADLREAISVSYDSPLADGIARNYQQRLSARNLSQAEIESLNQNYLEELRNAMRASLRINVDYRALGLDSATGLALAAELPRLWTSIYTTKYRIFTDKGVADLAVTRTEEDLASTASIITANTRIDAMQRGLATFIDDNRLSMLRIGEGVSAADLLIELRNFQSIWFNPVKVLALRGEDAIANAYLDELRFNVTEKRRQVEAFDATLRGLGDYQRSGQSVQVGQPPAIQGETTNTIQVGDSVFSGIIELAQRGSFAEFVERTLEERRDLMLELSALEKEREFAAASTKSGDITPEFRAQAAELLKALTVQYSQMLRAAEGQLRSRAGELAEPLLGPRLGGDRLLSSRSILIVGAAGLVGLLLTVIGVLVGEALRRPRADARAS